MRKIYSIEENSSYFVINEGNPEGAKAISSDAAAMHNQGNFGVFFAVNKFEKDRRLAGRLCEIRAIALDMDNGTKEELMRIIQKSPVEPSLIVETKNGYHVYFYVRKILVHDSTRTLRIDEFNLTVKHILPHFQFRTEGGVLVKRNNKAIGADNNAKDVCRILRVPGFFHKKDPNNPFLVNIVHEIDVEYDIKYLQKTFPMIIEPAKDVAPDGEVVPNYSLFWGEIIDRPVIDLLKALSGTLSVDKDEYDFRANANGTTQIIVNGKPTACFIDKENRIGSSDHGGPTIIQWLKWYGHSYNNIADIAKRLLLIEAPKPTNYKLMLQLTKNKDLITYKGDTYIYDIRAHIWKRQEDSFVRKIIHKICLDNGIDPTNGKVTDIHNLAIDHFYQKDIHFNVQKNILTFENTLLDISNPLEVTTLPFSPMYYSTILLPYQYNPSCKSEVWNTFLEQILPDEESRLLVQEMFGYCLTTSVEYHCAFFLDGSGRNGKSTFMEILAKMVGEENVSSVSFHTLSGRFGLQDMENKLINYDPEISSEHIANTAIFKAIVGGDPVEIERKFKDSYRARFFCKLVYAANELPSIRDRSLGFFSRLIIIPFEQQFTEEKGNIDRNIGKKLAEELPGIFNWALEGLQRLTRNRSFTKPNKSKIRLEEYQKENNSLLQFLEEMCVYEKDAKITARRFFAEYTEFCKESNLRAFSIKKVGLELSKLRGITKSYASNVITYTGITIRTEELY